MNWSGRGTRRRLFSDSYPIVVLECIDEGGTPMQLGVGLVGVRPCESLILLVAANRAVLSEWDPAVAYREMVYAFVVLFIGHLILVLG